MSDITNTKWKPFIKLTLAGENSCKGFAVIDANSKVSMIRDEDKELTVITLNDRNSYVVKESPDEICTLVDESIEKQVNKMKEEAEARRAELEKLYGSEVKEDVETNE